MMDYMAYMDLENLWTLMSTYTFIPDSDCIQDDLTCLICKKLMIDSFQSGCGCQYCHKCIREYLDGKNKPCLGRKRKCKEKYLSLEVNVLRNDKLNKSLLKLKVHCPKKSCQCVEELSRMEGHLRICMKETVDCPYVVFGCDNKEKGKISNHLAENTLNHTHLLLEYIQNIKNEVTTLKNESSHNAEEVTKQIKTILTNLEIEKEKSKDIKDEVETLKREHGIYRQETESKMKTMKEQSIEYEFEIKTLQEKMTTILRESGNEKKKWKEVKDELENLKKENEKYRQETYSNMKTMNEESEKREDKIKEEIKSIRTELGNETKKWKEVKDELETLKKENEKYRQKTDSNMKTMNEESKKREKSIEKSVHDLIKEMYERIDKLKDTIQRMDVWTHEKVKVEESFVCVDKFSVRKIQNEEILSPYFYSHTNGYKLRLKVFPGGKGKDKGTFLSVLVVLCKGEYDDQLPWPCKHSIKISLINQVNQMEHFSKTLNYSNENKYLYNKPRDKDNTELGSVTFSFVNDLRSMFGFIVSDVVVIKCTVTAPALPQQNTFLKIFKGLF